METTEEAKRPTADSYVYARDLRQQAKVPENGILSQTLHSDERSKVVLFGFAAGQELSAHTAPYPATLLFLKGDALLKLGAEEQEAGEGSFVYMAPYLEHGIKARNEVVMVLTMIKGGA
jgi:quercetin dioxygenase-like cupin family protein